MSVEVHQPTCSTSNFYQRPIRAGGGLEGVRPGLGGDRAGGGLGRPQLPVPAAGGTAATRHRTGLAICSFVIFGRITSDLGLIYFARRRVRFCWGAPWGSALCLNVILTLHATKGVTERLSLFVWRSHHGKWRGGTATEEGVTTARTGARGRAQVRGASLY